MFFEHISQVQIQMSLGKMLHTGIFCAHRF